MNPAQRNLLQEFFDIWNYPLLALREDSLTIGGLVLLLVLGYLLFRYGPKCNSHLLRFIQGKVVIPAEYRKGIVRVTRALVFIAGACLIVKIAKIDHFIFGQINELYDTVHGMFDLKLFIAFMAFKGGATSPKRERKTMAFGGMVMNGKGGDLQND